MCWQLHSVNDRFCDILGDKRCGNVVIDRISSSSVALESSERKLVGLHHPRRNLEYANRFTGELEAKDCDHCRRRELGGVVTRPALVGDVAGD